MLLPSSFIFTIIIHSTICQQPAQCEISQINYRASYIECLVINTFVFKWLQLDINTTELFITFQEPSATNIKQAPLAKRKIN